MGSIIEHEGTIIGRISPTKLSVKIVQQSACSACKVAGMCSAAESKEKIIEAYSDDATIAIGDAVIVYGKMALGYKALTLAIVLPLVLSALTLFLVSNATGNDLASGLSALGILVPYYCVLALMRNKLQREFIFRVKRNNKQTI